MLFTPFNFSFSLQRVAVFEWEPAPPADTAAPAPPTAPCDDAAAQAAQQAADPPPGMQPVFKGYEWASVANCSLFPRPSFEDCFVGGPDAAAEKTDSLESERRARQNEAARRARHAVGAPDQPNAADGSCGTPTPFDPSKLRQR